ncbi:hypothetical protein [Singulisphaera sp. PoT]|uniref:hypothetical protein n=1 Tax=Singulisphaera sp. PoT TaxID=3411797 RepID=UPI003BF5F728
MTCDNRVLGDPGLSERKQWSVVLTGPSLARWSEVFVVVERRSGRRARAGSWVMRVISMVWGRG